MNMSGNHENEWEYVDSRSIGKGKKMKMRSTCTHHTALQINQNRLNIIIFTSTSHNHSTYFSSELAALNTV